MDNMYDLIVVGAGNAGLSAAATGAENGLKTLLIEKNILPGGCASSFRRGRFEFETALHEFAGIGSPENPGKVRKLFEEYGADIDFRLHDVAFRVIAKGKDGFDAVMPAGTKEFIEEMEKNVPGCKESVIRAFEIGKQIMDATAYLSKGKPDPAVLISEYPDFMVAASHSVKECLDALDMPKKAQDLLTTYWSYIGAPTEMLDFSHFMTVLLLYIQLKPAMPAMRSHEISLAMDDSIRRHGGEIWYSTEVTSFITDEDGRVCGVNVDGKKVMAKHVIANIYPDVAYQKMFPDHKVPEMALKLSNAREPGVLFFTMYLGLDRSADELGIKDYSVFIEDDPDSNVQFKSLNESGEGMLIVNCLNRYIPDCSPKGTCMLFFTTFFSEKSWGNIEPENYKREKEKIAERLIKKYEETLGVSIMPHIEEIDICTPATFARYLGTPNGTPYGYQLSRWDTMMSRIMSLRSEQFIPGLTFVGAHAERADGYSTTYSCGHNAAMNVVREVKKNG